MSRRRRRGDAATPAPADHVPLPEQLDPAVFRRVDDTLWAFANRRLAPVVAAVGGAFLGPSRPDERQLQEIQLALRAYATLGYADVHGNRIVDMFASHGVNLPRDQQEAVQSLKQAAYGLYTVDGVREPDMTVHDFMREETFTLRDRNAAASLSPGDQLLAWVVPSRTAWHPVGAALHVPGTHRAPVEVALRQLASSMSAPLAELPSTHPVHVFWTVFRVVNALRPAG